MRLGLRYNHGDESLDVGPDDAALASRGGVVALPGDDGALVDPRLAAALRDDRAAEPLREMRAVVAWGVRYVGHPYVWGGDWDEADAVRLLLRLPAARRVRLLGADVVGA